MFDKRLMELCPESRKYIIGNIILQWLEMLMNVLMIFSVANVFEACLNNSYTHLSIDIIVIIITAVVRFFLSRYALKMSHLASRTIMGKMRVLIYDKLLKLGSRYTEKVSTAELVQESVEGVEQLESYFGQYVPQFFYAFLAPITLFILFGYLGSWSTGLVLLVCVPLIPGAIMMVQKIAKKILNKYWGKYTQLGSSFLENLQALITLKTYKADEYKNEEMNKESEEFRVVTMKVLTMQLNSIIIMDFFTYAGAALGIIMATKAFNNDSINLKACLSMILLSAEFFLPMRRLGSYFHVAMNGMAASDRIFNFLSLDDPKDKLVELDKEGGDIEIKDLSFAYDDEHEVLENINIIIPKGSFVGIVGESGSGKSTIAALLMGRHAYKKGNITIGGNDLNEINTKSLMNCITYVGINSRFFKGTIKDNLLMSNPDSSDEELWKVLEDMQISDFFKNENGLDTLLTENANNLSGGQRQRLALARAILHDTSIYIFDEAASNIDVESEEIINQCIKNLNKNKTIIMISHRLVNTMDADEIYVLKDGKLVEHGKHQELLNNKNVYAEMFNTQKELEAFGRNQ